jgi:hypothetical protein
MRIQFAGRLTRSEFLHAFEVAGEPLVVDGLQAPPKILSAPVIVSAAGLAVALAAGIIIIGYRMATSSVGKLTEIAWMISLVVLLSILGLAFRAGEAFRQQWKSRRSLREPLEGTTAYEGIELRSLSEQRHLGWADFSRYRWDERLVVLFYHTGQWIPFPKRYFESEADWEAFRIIVARELNSDHQAAEQRVPRWLGVLAAILVAALTGLVLLGIEVARTVTLALTPSSHDLWRRVVLIDTVPLLASVMTGVGAMLTLLLTAIPTLLASLWPTFVYSRFVDTPRSDKLITRSQVLHRWVDQFASLGFVTIGVRVEGPLWGLRSREMAFASKKAEAYGDVTVAQFGMLNETTHLYTPFAAGGIVLTTNWTRAKPAKSVHESVMVVASSNLEQLLKVHTERVRAFKDQGRIPVIGYTAESRIAAAHQYYASAAGRRSMRRYAARAGALAGLLLIVTVAIIAAGLALEGVKPWYEFDL